MWTTVLGAGGTIVLQPKFSASRFWGVIAKHDVTHISLLPIVYTTIAGQTIPPNKLEVGVFGAIAPPIEQLLGGVKVVPAFGMTETVIHATTAAPYQHIPSGSMGTPTPGYEMLVVDPVTDEVLTDGRIGELLVRGTRGIQLFLEYYGNPDATAESFTEDGFFKTGDRVRVGAGGAIFYSERDKDMLKVGGENVSAKEIEDLCRQVPGVRDVAVVGRSHPNLDEVPVAFVIKGPTQPPTWRSSARSSRLPGRTWRTSRFLAPCTTSTISPGRRSTRWRRTSFVSVQKDFPSRSEALSGFVHALGRSGRQWRWYLFSLSVLRLDSRNLRANPA